MLDKNLNVRAPTPRELWWILLIVFLSNVLDAQEREQPLSIPSSNFRCERHEIIGTKRDSIGIVSFIFIVGDRRIYATFDSLDAPKTFSESLMLREADGTRAMEMRTVVFQLRRDIGMYAKVAQRDSTAMKAPLRPRMPDPLPESEMTRARALAAWVWDHRCH